MTQRYRTCKLLTSVLLNALAFVTVVPVDGVLADGDDDDDDDGDGVDCMIGNCEKSKFIIGWAVDDSFVDVTGTKRGDAVAAGDAVLLDCSDAGVDSIRNNFGGGGLSSALDLPISFNYKERESVMLQIYLNGE